MRRRTEDWFDQIISQTVQRRKTFARRGAEIGLKAGSHPTGIFSNRACSGLAGDPNWCDLLIGVKSGKRSPLSVRSTLTGGAVVSHSGAEFGMEGNAIKLAAPKASATLVKRTKKRTRIGPSPKTSTQRLPASPISPARLAWRVQKRVCALRGSARCIRTISKSLMRCSQLREEAFANGALSRLCRNQMAGCGLSWGPAILPPFPPCWPVILGAAAGPSSAAPEFFCKGHSGHSGRRARRDYPEIHNYRRGDYGYRVRGPGPRPGMTTMKVRRSPAVRAAAPCVRRTAPDLRRRRPPQAGTAWRSGMPAPAVSRSGIARGRP